MLGTISAERDGQTVSLAPRKYTSLFAFLALHPGRSFSRDELADRFWPNSDIERGRGALRTALSTLRKTFGPDVLPEGGDVVSLRPTLLSTDVERFVVVLREARATQDAAAERQLLREALVLYTGPLLPALYDDWLLEKRDALARQRDEALERERVLTEMAERAARSQPHPPKTIGAQLVTLPRFASRFLGRVAERETLKALLLRPEVRLVTLTGLGGMGKTRLALETVSSLTGRFTGAVAFVPLADCPDGASLFSFLAQALQVAVAAGTGEPGGEVLRRLAEWGPSLLILDNLEHLLDQGASAWVASLLASLPDLTILATSRAFLGIAGEHEYALSPLPPDDAIALFVQHAGAIQPDFDVEEAAALAAVCEHLEGIPLAIELCAPWVRVLSLREIDERLQDRFDLLTTRRRDLPERHRSLSAALEGGCPTEPGLRQFFLQLSVFRGGFDREAAEAVCGGGDALGRIAELCERSLLLTVRGKQGETRYRVLETVRQYADELLGATERSLALRRHLAHFSARAHRETPLLAGSEAARWFERLDREVPNFRVAIDFGIEDTSQSRVQVRGLIDDLAWFLGMRGHAAPIAEWRSKLYERRQEQADEERAWIILDYSASVEAAAERKRLLEEALQLFKSLGNDGGMSMILERLARLSIERKDWDETRRLYSEAIRLREVAGDLRGAGYAMAVLAGALVEAGFSDEAYALRQRCREIAREFNDEGSIAVLDRADAWQFIERNQPERSIGLLENAAATFRRHGYTWQLMDTLLRLGEAFLQVENREQARVSWQEALPLAERCGDRNRHDQIRDYLETLAQPRTEANPDANPVIS